MERRIEFCDIVKIPDQLTFGSHDYYMALQVSQVVASCLPIILFTFRFEV